MIRATVISLAAIAPSLAAALTLELPASAVPVAERAAPLDSHFVATAGYDEDVAIEGIVAEGALTQRSWRIGSGGLTTLQLLAPLREQLTAAGFEPVFECDARSCGGFDFRYGLDVLPEPDMHVNLGDFRYFAARRAGEPEEFATLLVSRSANAAFVQLTRIGAGDEAAVVTSTKAPDPAGPLPPLGQRLETRGFARLDDLTFETGSSTLGDEEFATLQSLAEYLKARPDTRVTLVGHTDAEGALAGNIALSKRRAQAVADRLVDRYGIPRGQVASDGVGFLAPRSSNLTDEGRTQNRRVEVILTSTQ